MKTVNEFKKEYVLAKLMLDFLDQLALKMETGQGMDMVHLEEMMEFLKALLDSCQHESLASLSSRQSQTENFRQEALAEHKKGWDLVRGMQIAFYQYQRGADRAAQEFSRNARACTALLKQHLDNLNRNRFMGSSGIYFSAEQEKRFEGFLRSIHKSSRPSFESPLKKIKGIYLVD